MDRVPPSEGDGRGFDSRREHHDLFDKIHLILNANVAELVDALGSGLSVFDVRVRVPPFAPYQEKSSIFNPQKILQILISYSLYFKKLTLIFTY